MAYNIFTGQNDTVEKPQSGSFDIFGPVQKSQPTSVPDAVDSVMQSTPKRSFLASIFAPIAKPKTQDQIDAKAQTDADKKKIIDDVFKQIHTPAPFVQDIKDAVSKFPAFINPFAPVVAEAPSIEENQGTASDQDQKLTGLKAKIDATKVDTSSQKSVDDYNAMVNEYNATAKTPIKPSLTDTYYQQHPLYRADNILGSSIVKGATGGQAQPMTVEPKTFTEKALAGVGQGLGAVGTIDLIGSKLGAITTPAALTDFVSQYPKVAKYALPIVSRVLADIPGFVAYGQLSPDLKTFGDRLKSAVQSIAFAGTSGVLSPLPKFASIPLNGAAFFGLAKLNGATNDDAVAQGAVGMFFDAMSPQLKFAGQEVGFTKTSEVNNILRDTAIDNINQFSDTKITKDSSDAQIKKAYREAISKVHPDVGGTDQQAATVNNSYEFLSGKTENFNPTKPTQEAPAKNPVTEQDISDIADQFKPQPEEKPVYKTSEQGLSTKILEDLQGRETVSKQYILDATNRPELKQQERDIIREALKKEGNTVNVAEFTKKIQSELLPLTRENKSIDFGNGEEKGTITNYENIVLPDDVRGYLKDYSENIYQSPIKTSAGETHFQMLSDAKQNYFGHTRVEDMADDITRRVIEVQSDLYQKGNLEKELSEEPNLEIYKKDGTPKTDAELAREKKRIQNKKNKLKQYNDPTAHFRMVREEVKQAAEDGKKKLLFPTGETAMKIEGLGQNNPWSERGEDGVVFDLEPNDLKIGKIVTQGGAGYGQDWIITDVLGDGKFKATQDLMLQNDADFYKYLSRNNLLDDGRVPSAEELTSHLDDEGFKLLSKISEQFDISGNIDEKNPIYRFYEKDLGRYLKSNFDAKVITDRKGITWYEVDLTKKDYANQPVMAFKKETAAEISGEEAVAKAKEMLNRIGIKGPDVKLVDTILTGTVKDGKPLMAYGSYFDRNIEIAKRVAKYTGEHEVIHLVFKDIARIPLFKGIMKSEILGELKKKYPSLKTNEQLEEQLALDFEDYAKDKESGKSGSWTGKIKEFFDRIYGAVKKFLGITQEEYQKIADFYEKAYSGTGAEVELKPSGLVEKPAFKSKVQRQIDENMSPKPEEITRPENVLLNERFRNQARGAKEGFKAGFEEARQSIVSQLRNSFEAKESDIKRSAELDQLKQRIKDRYNKEVAVEKLKQGSERAVAILTNKYEEQIAKIERTQELGSLKENIKTRDFDRVKGEIVNYAKEALPISEQGKFLIAVKNSKTQKDLIKAFSRIDNVAQKYELKTAIARLKKTAQKLSESPSISVDYRNKIASVIDQYELAGHSQKMLDELQATQDYLDNAKENGEDVELPQTILNKLRILSRVSKDELTLDQVQGLQNQIELLGHLGKTKFETRQNLYESEKAVRKAVLEETATPINSKGKPVRAIGETKKAWLDRYINLRNYLQKSSIALKPIDGLAEITGMVPMKQDLDLDFGNYLPYNDDRFAKMDEIITRNDLTQGNIERVGVYAISQQDGGTERLVANNGIPEEAIKDLKLSEGEQELYNYIIEENKKGYPIVKELAKNLYNVDVGQVKNYVSFHSDMDAMNDLEVYDRFGARPQEAMTEQHLKKNVEKGFIESRAKFANNPLQIDIAKVFERHWDDVAWMDTMARDIKMYSEIVNSPEMRQKLGDVGTLAWRQWLDLMARKGGVEGSHRIRALDVLRKNIGAGVLAFRLSSALVQFSSFADTVGTIGAEWATKGARDIATSKEWRNFIMDNFPEVRKAMGDDLAFREFGDDFFGKMAKFGLKPLEVLDNLMRSTAAAGAYEKIANERGVEVDLNNPDQDIVQEATRLMRFSQGSSFFKDQPLAITAGYGITENRSLNKTLFTFQSFMLNRWDNLKRQVWRQGIKEKNYTKAFMSLFWLIIFASAMEEGIRRGTRKIQDLITGDTTNEKGFVANAASNVIQGVPILGQLVSALTYSSNPVPIINSFEDTLAGIGSAITGKSGSTKAKGGVKALGGIGSLLGIPGSSQFSQLAGKAIKGTPSDPLKAKLSNSVDSAQKKVDALDQDLVKEVEPLYQKAKEAGFGTPEADAIVTDMSDAEYAVYKDLKAVDVAKDTLDSADKIKEVVDKAHTAGFGTPEADAIVDKLSDTEYDQYKKVKSLLYKNGEPISDVPTDEMTSDEAKRNVFQLVTAYAKAYGIDPGNAFKAMFTKETLGKVEGNLVELQRFGGIPYDAPGGSQEYKKNLLEKMGIPWDKRGDYKLEHIIPVDAGGGSFDPNNLVAISNAEHDSYTPFDIALGDALKEKRLTRREGMKIAKQLKVEKSITVDEALEMVKKAD